MYQKENKCSIEKHSLPSQPTSGISAAERSLWWQRGHAYAMRLLLAGLSSSELTKSLAFTTKDCETVGVAEAVAILSEPDYSLRRSEREAAFIAGAMAAAAAAGGLGIGAEFHRRPEAKIVT